MNLADLARLAQDEVSPLVDDVLQTLQRDDPGWSAGRGLNPDAVRPVMEGVFTAFLSALTDGGDVRGGADDSTVALDSAIGLRIDQGAQLTELLRSYRICAAAIWRHLARLAGDDPGGRQALIDATPRVFELLDHYSAHVNTVYRDHALQLARAQEQVRASLLDIVLSGDPAHGSYFWDAVVALDVPQRARFVVVDVVAEATLAKQAVTERVVRGFAGVESAWFRLGLRSQVGLLVLRQSDRGAAEVATHIQGKLGVRVGVSAPFELIDDAAAGRVQAGVAAAATSVHRPVVVYETDVLEVLMASSPRAARNLMRASLGGLTDLPPSRSGPLIDTVRTWLQNKRSLEATAKAMHCHRNTVGYRLHRFEELTGGTFDDDLWVAQITLAVNSQLLDERTE